jgi:hypothetical protein
VTEIRYSSRNSTAHEHSMITRCSGNPRSHTYREFWHGTGSTAWSSTGSPSGDRCDAPSPARPRRLPHETAAARPVAAESSTRRCGQQESGSQESGGAISPESSPRCCRRPRG